MTMSRRVVVGLVVLLALGLGVVWLVPRVRETATGPANASATNTPAVDTIPHTSEELIADAVKAGDLTYEESLLQRAYAIFDDPRLDRRFRSPVINWQAAVPLLYEINQKEQTLSSQLLADLTPFRVRPSDPRSIVNRSRADVLPALNAQPMRWESYLVPGTRVRVWMMGREQILRQKYAPLVQQVWGVFDRYFPLPSGDMGDSTYDPDDAIDIYLLPDADLDPRRSECIRNPALANCALAQDGSTGMAPPTPGSVDRNSGYVLADIALPDDWLRQVFAHELAHVTQHNYDAGEATLAGMGEGTATWVEYKVIKALNKVPDMSYNLLDPAVGGIVLFRNFHVSLNRLSSNYRSWLFYLHASMDLGDDVVTRIWERAAQSGFDGYNAVDHVAPFKTHFPTFSVRNWNVDPVPNQYKTGDRGFRPQSKPTLVKPLPAGLGRVTLDEPLLELSARYYHYSSFDSAVRRITLLNFYVEPPLENAHLWAIKKVGNDWKPPEDWSGHSRITLCRDLPAEDVSELVLVVSNSHMTQPVPPQHPHPVVVSEDVGCETVEGTASATLRLNDPERMTDMTYVASLTTVQFKPRSVQDQEFNTAYDLLPTSVVWSVAGRKDGCTVNGRTVATIPSFLDQPLDPTRPAYGYLNVVSKQGGDFHSVEISAINPTAMMTKTCPGDPPRVSQEPFAAQWLLKILTQKNTHVGDAVHFTGRQTLDPERFQDNLPPEALEVLKNFPQANALLNRRGGKMVYTFDWELKPRVRSP